jgi:hypothetical protein
VISCRHCGAELPDHASFCLQCGRPVTEAEPEAPARGPSPQTELDFVQPALSGGMFLGFLSSIPFISVGNVFCCMWVLLGGGIAAIMLTRQRPSGIKYGDGAFVGVLSGLIGAVVGTLVQLSFRAMTARVLESQQQQLEQMLQQYGIQGAMRDWMLRMASGEISAETVIFIFFSNLFIYSLFAMIGGILTVAILSRRKGAGINPRPDIPA